MRPKRSKWEDTVGKTLSTLSIKWLYEPKTFEYVVPERKAKYTPDFELLKNKVYIEAKGYFRPVDRTKLRRFKKSHPGVIVILVFQEDKKIKGTKLRYSDWAKKNDFPYVVGLKDPKALHDAVSTLWPKSP